MQDLVGFPLSVAWRGPGNPLCGQRRKCLFAHFDAFPKGTCVKSMLQNAICPLRKCPPGNICCLRRKTNVPVQTSGKGATCVGSFLPRIIGLGRAAQEAVLHRDVAC